MRFPEYPFSCRPPLSPPCLLPSGEMGKEEGGGAFCKKGTLKIAKADVAPSNFPSETGLGVARVWRREGAARTTTHKHTRERGTWSQEERGIEEATGGKQREADMDEGRRATGGREGRRQERREGGRARTG